MSAQQYGARLLDEVQEEGLDKLLKELRTTLNPTPKSILGFPEIDRLLETLRYPTRPSPRRSAWATQDNDEGNIIDDLHDEDSPDHAPPRPKSKPPIIHLTSTKSNSGKTSLLYHLTSLAILPTQHGGKEATVVWIDTDQTFSATRLCSIANNVLTNANIPTNSDAQSTSSLSTNAIDAIITSSLKHLYVLQPTSSVSLINTLSRLPMHILTHTVSTSPNRPLGLLVLDSASAFQHQDRFDAEIARLEAGAAHFGGAGVAGGSGGGSSVSKQLQVINELKRIQQEFECAVIFSTLTQPPLRQSTNLPPQSRTYQQPGSSTATATSTSNTATIPTLAPPAAFPARSQPAQNNAISLFTTSSTLNLFLNPLSTSTHIPTFAPSMTHQECLRDREKRLDAVRKGRIGVGVVLEGIGSEAMNRLGETTGRSMGMGSGMDGEGRMGFVIRVTDEGVEVERE